MQPYPISNRLLDALPEADRRGLLSHLEPVSLPLGTTLFESHERPRYVHLMTSGLCSHVTIMEDGTAIEVGLSGRENFPEGLHMLGPEVGTKRGIVQVAGTALRMPLPPFEREFHRNEALRRLVLRSIQYEALVLAQIAACNRLHEVHERLARWLLMVQDRTGSSHMTLTQEFLAQMLGTRRSSVTLAAGNLQSSGIIEYQRGDICIKDTSRLREVACECTQVIHRLFENLYQ